MALQAPGTLSGESSNAVGLDDGVAEVTRHVSISTQCMLAYSSDVGTDYGDVGSRRSEATLDCLLQ